MRQGMIRKGIRYFPKYTDARTIRNLMGHEARLVFYELGWAVQYFPGGPYYPQDAPEPCYCRGCMPDGSYVGTLAPRAFAD